MYSSVLYRSIQKMLSFLKLKFPLWIYYQAKLVSHNGFISKIFSRTFCMFVILPAYYIVLECSVNMTVFDMIGYLSMQNKFLWIFEIITVTVLLGGIFFRNPIVFLHFSRWVHHILQMIYSVMVLGCMQVLYMRLCATNCNGRDDVLEQIVMLFPVFAFKIMTNTLGFVSRLELSFILSHNKR